MSESARDLDPYDWAEFRRLSHRALDDMITFIEQVRTRPVWVDTPAAVRARFLAGIPCEGRDFETVLQDFEQFIKPYATGNLHPAFMGWVHGAGTPVGMVADMLAAGLNANCGGRNHIGLEVEQQITRWMRQIFGFPETASGLFVTGTSIANYLGLLVARNSVLGDQVRRTGLRGHSQLCGYASAAAHGCISQAFELAGIGSDNLRRIACNEAGEMDVPALSRAIAVDRASTLLPFLVVGSAGTVDIGAVDPLSSIADVTRREGLWFHVDGAFGALAALCPRLAPVLDGMERADSIAFDFHKWAHVPYDAGFLLVRDGNAHRRTFVSDDAYLSRSASGLAAGDLWPCDLGPDLSRGFKALKTWFTFQVYGTAGLGAAMAKSCDLAQHLAASIESSARFELAAPVRLNIVCLSARTESPDRANREIVDHLHVTGLAAPSITSLGGKAVIRCAINNHRTDRDDIRRLIEHFDQAYDRLASS